MPSALLRPFPIFVLAAAAACAGVVGFTASAGIRDDMAGRDGRGDRSPRRRTVVALARRPGFAALVARPPALAADAVRRRQPRRRRAAGLADALHHRSEPRDLDGRRPLAPMPSVHSCVVVLLGGRHRCRRRRPTSTTTRSTRCRRPIRRRCARRAQAGSVQHRQLRVPADVPARCRASCGSSTPDFWGFRRLWFALNLGLVVVVGRPRDRAAPRRAAGHARACG